jgi:hypothetical protein
MIPGGMWECYDIKDYHGNPKYFFHAKHLDELPLGAWFEIDLQTTLTTDWNLYKDDPPE